MIYLTFDTNIWIYSLDESWQIENQLDYLEPWIQTGKVKLLHPRIIMDEWRKHEDEQVRVREKRLADFFKMAEEILPSAFFAEYKEPATQKKIIEDQLTRAKNLIFQSQVIPDYSEVKDRVLFDGIAKKAPMHKKSSVADAVIIFSLIQFSKLNQGNQYFFISNNTDDFYEKANGKREIHQDLKSDFDNCNIQAFSTLNQLIINLQREHDLKVDNVEQKRKERIRNKIREKIYNPEYDKLTESGEVSYIRNISTIEFILKERKPTKEQVIFTLALIDYDISYERDFYKRLTQSSWFEILKRKGVFNPSNNPEPIQVDEGVRVPYWEVLSYLEKLSVQISQGSNSEYIDEILAVIKHVSENPRDNYSTWYLFIKILYNLPNEKVSKEILNFIPTWLSGRFDTMLQTSELCDKLLPKFLNDSPTKEDIEKAELILHHLFHVEKKTTEDNNWDNEGEGYSSRIYLHFLSNKFERGNLISKIAKYSSLNLILELGRTIKFLLLDYSNGINSQLKDGTIQYKFRIRVDKENLVISSKVEGSSSHYSTSVLRNWEEKDETELKREFISIIEEQGINYVPSDDDDDPFQRLRYALTTDVLSTFGYNSIRKLDDEFSNDEKVANTFSLIFRNLLDEKAKQSPEETSFLLNTFCSDKQYYISFYKSVTLYVISENWSTIKPVFWKLLEGNDALHLFSNYTYQQELYTILSQNQHSLSEDEKTILQKIIDQGKQVNIDTEDEKDKEYWQLRWYAALKDTEPFKQKYISLSRLLKLTSEHFENSGKIVWKSGSVSPLTQEKLLEMSNENIAEYFRTFRPKDHWENINISGLAKAFGDAVGLEPDKFVNGIGCYEETYYIYSYYLLNGLSEAWKQKKLFDWEKVLNYCLSTLQNEKFFSGKLQAEDHKWDATADWVVGSIADLLTEGLQNDENAFNTGFLPLAKEIVLLLVDTLQPVNDFEARKTDYLTYSLNSTAGRCLRTLVNYSLNRATNLFEYEYPNKWEPEIKASFERTFQKGILDANFLLGRYFEQFCFLDRKWVLEKVRQQYESEEREWLAFMSGLVFSSPPPNEETYNLLYPHYKKVIDKNIKLKSFLNNGLVEHLAAFYFWKFKTLSSKKLLLKFLEKSTPDGVSDLIIFICQQKDYQSSLTDIERKDFQRLILELWKYLADKYEIPANEEEHKNLTLLANWLIFAPELNDTYTNLVLKSCKHANRNPSTHQVLENLLALKDKGSPIIAARSVGKILSHLNFKDYILDTDKDSIKELVSFLYTHGQKPTADIFCNRLASDHQQLFLREVYEANLWN